MSDLDFSTNPDFLGLDKEAKRKVLSAHNSDFASLGAPEQDKVLDRYSGPPQATQETGFKGLLQRMGGGPIQLSADTVSKGRDILNAPDPSSPLAIAGLSMIPGAAAESMAGPALENLPPALQGLFRGLIGAGAGVGGGQMVANAIDKKPLAQDLGSKGNIAAYLLAAGIPSAAGLFAKVGSESLPAIRSDLTTDYSKATGIDPEALRHASLANLSGPIQAGMQAKEAMDVSRQASLSTADQLTKDLVSKQLKHIDLQAQLRDAQANLTAATQTNNQDLLNSSKEMINSIQSQMAETKVAGAQARAQYIDTRNQIQEHLRQLEEAVGKSKASKMPEYQDAKRVLDRLKDEYDATSAGFGVTSSGEASGLKTAQQQPIKLDLEAAKGLPETGEFTAAKRAVADSNDEIRRQQLLVKQAKLQSTNPQAMTAVDSQPNGRNLYQDLINTKTNEDFNNYLLEPNHLRVALAAMPEQADSIKSAVFSTLFQRSLRNGVLDPSKMEKVWLGNDGQGLESLRIALGPVADATEPLQQKIRQFAEFCAASGENARDRWVKWGEHYIGFRALMATGGALAAGTLGGAHGATLGGEVAGGVAGIAAISGFNTIARRFFTSDAFRQGAMEWARGGKVGAGSSDAIRAFAAMMHSNDGQVGNE